MVLVQIVPLLHRAWGKKAQIPFLELIFPSVILEIFPPFSRFLALPLLHILLEYFSSPPPLKNNKIISITDTINPNILYNYKPR